MKEISQNRIVIELCKNNSNPKNGGRTTQMAESGGYRFSSFIPRAGPEGDI